MRKIKIVGANEPFKHLVGEYLESDLDLLDLGTYTFEVAGCKYVIWPYTWVYAEGATELEGWASDYENQYGRLTIKISPNE